MKHHKTNQDTKRQTGSTKCLIPRSTEPYLKSFIFQPIKKRPVFYATWMSITAFTTAWHLSLSWARSIQSICPTDLFKIHFSITLPSRLRSSKWNFSLRFPTKTRYASSLSHTCYMPCFLILFDLITWTIPSDDYQSRSSAFCHLLQSPVMSSHLDSTQVQISSLVPYYSIASAYVLLSVSETKFRTHTKQLAKLDCCIFQMLYFRKAKGETKHSGPKDCGHSYNSTCS